MRIIPEVANNTLGTIKMTNLRGSTAPTKSHDGMGNVQTAEGDSPLKGTNETLALDNIFRGTQFTDVQLRMVTLRQRGVHLLWRISLKHLVAGVAETLDVSLATQTESAILVTKVVGTQMVLREANTLELAVPGRRLKGFH